MSEIMLLTTILVSCIAQAALWTWVNWRRLDRWGDESAKVFAKWIEWVRDDASDD